MSKILVYLQAKDNQLLPQSLSAIAAAQQLAQLREGATLTGVFIGETAQANAEKLASASYGLTEIYYAEALELKQFTAVNYGKVLARAFVQSAADLLLAATTSEGRDILPVVAASNNLPQISDVTAVLSANSFERPVYAGNVLATAATQAQQFVVSVRAASFSAAELDASGTATISVLSDLPAFDGRISVTGYELAEQDRPDLAAADVVISGGRALGSAENFEKIIYPLADKLGAAVGASRAAVDAGFAPNDWQVGQTGKIVAPKLYIAIGLSGAIQHLAGMKDSGVIVAINSDPEAAIFEHADYGLVADLFEVVPELTEKL